MEEIIEEIIEEINWEKKYNEAKYEIKCLEFEKNINDIKNTYPWAWGEELDSSGKEHIIKAFIDSIHKD